MKDADPVRFACPHCQQKIRARRAPTATEAHCPACGQRFPLPERHAEDRFDWTGVAGERAASVPASEERTPRSRNADQTRILVWVGIASGLLLVVGGVALAVVFTSGRATKPEPQPVAQTPTPPEQAPVAPTPKQSVPLQVEITRSEPEKVYADDDLHVWLRGGRPGEAEPRFQYRTDPQGAWQPAAGNRVQVKASAGTLTLHVRAVAGDDVSPVLSRTWTVERRVVPLTVAVARVTPDKPRAGVRLGVQFQVNPPGEAVTYQYRTAPDGPWQDAVGDFVSLPEAREGEVRIEVRARTPDGRTSEPLTHTIAVPAVLVTKDPARKYPGHRACAHGVAFVPGRQEFLSGSCDGTLKLWDTTDPMPLAEFKQVQGQVFALDVSADGRWAVTGGTDTTRKTGAVQLWDLEKRTLLRNLTGHTGRVTSVKFSPDGSAIVSGSADGTVRLWEFATGKEVRVLKEEKALFMAVAFSENGQRVLGAGSLNGEGIIRHWDRTSGELLARIAAPTRRVTGVAFLGDERVLSSAGRVFASETSAVDTHVRVWDTRTQKEAGSFLGNPQGIASLAVTFDNKYVFCAAGDATMQLREVTGGGEVRRFEGHAKKVLCMAISRDSRYVITGSEDGQLFLWDLPKEVHIPEKLRP